jgi:hypothetical protein
MNGQSTIKPVSAVRHSHNDRELTKERTVRTRAIKSPIAKAQYFSLE